MIITFNKEKKSISAIANDYALLGALMMVYQIAQDTICIEKRSHV